MWLRLPTTIRLCRIRFATGCCSAGSARPRPTSSKTHEPFAICRRSICRGRRLAASMLNLGILESARQALAELNVDIDELIELEEEPGLGNGGLGRLAACFMDSLATLQIPAIGYGIRYEYGIFDQTIKDGWQVEVADTWLRYGNPWEMRRARIGFDVPIGGHTEPWVDDEGRHRRRWVAAEILHGVANDTPVLGYGVDNTNLLRLWSAEASESFDFQVFNTGDYFGAVHRKIRSETVSKVLYPNDDPEVGKRLRLIQQHFFTSCSLQDMIRIFRQSGQGLEHFHEKYAVQLNDTHPALAVAELMRLLIDEHLLDWKTAWNVVSHTFAYTNHTLLPEALEKWEIPLFESILPRHLEIIYEINHHFLARGEVAIPGRPGTHGPHVIDRRIRAEARAHGLPGLRGELCDQRRGRASLAAVGKHGTERLPRSVAEEIQQQDQWRNAAAVPGAVQSEL